MTEHAVSNVAPFPEHRTRTQPEQLIRGDWFITRGPAERGPAAWMSWVVESAAPVDHGGSVGLAVEAMPLVAPDGTWPYGDFPRETQWVPLSRIEIVCPMPDVPQTESRA